MNRPVDILFQKIVGIKEDVYKKTGYKLHAFKSAKEGRVVCFLNGHGRVARIDVPANAYDKTVKSLIKMFINIALMKWEDCHDAYDI